jgi:putative mRNA 3-end processing factor
VLLHAHQLGFAQGQLQTLAFQLELGCAFLVETDIAVLPGDLGIALPPTLNVGALDKAGLSRCFALAPPHAVQSGWIRRFGDHSDAFASGWMRLRGNRRRRGVDQGFALSDHADWPGLLQAIAATGAARIFVTHGSGEALSRYLRERGYDARPMATEYGDEALEGEAEPNIEADTDGA